MCRCIKEKLLFTFEGCLLEDLHGVEGPVVSPGHLPHQEYFAEGALHKRNQIKRQR